MATACTRCNRPLKNPASVRNGMGPVCFSKAQAHAASSRRGGESSYRVVKTDSAARIVWIADLDEGLSVTNDAERVVGALNADYPGFRVIYRDTLGFWDELKHEDGEFRGFAPARDLSLAVPT